MEAEWSEGKAHEMERPARFGGRGGSNQWALPTPIPRVKREYRLLEYLMRHLGQVVTRTMLLENVWDLYFDPHTNVVETHISRLRAKIDRGRGVPLISTVRGFGYSISAAS